MPDTKDHSDINSSTGVRFADQVPSAAPAERRRLQRPHTAAAGAPFLDANGNRTQPSRDGNNNSSTKSNKLPQQPSTSNLLQQQQEPQQKTKKRRRKKRRPKTAIGAQTSTATAGAASAALELGGGSHEPNFPTLNPRVFHALRGYLTPESLRKTKFYSDREQRMSHRREQLDDQEKRLEDRMRGFYKRLDNFIEETNAASRWEPEDKRKQHSFLDDL